MTTYFDSLHVEQEAGPAPRPGIGYFAGGAMLLTAVVLWLAAWAQLRILSPPITKLVSSQYVDIAKKREVKAFWAFPWRGLGPDAARVAAVAIIASLVLCAAVRRWWAWGVALVAFPFALNWYITLCLLLPALVVVDKMRL
ncbi:MAG TPA: hypothetical protein VNC50_14745 [Planctomycetia bacterium]|nr:hypothetical protein [Planctomycetia bacterium]